MRLRSGVIDELQLPEEPHDLRPDACAAYVLQILIAWRAENVRRS
jgi:hypothetical protein